MDEEGPTRTPDRPSSTPPTSPLPRGYVPDYDPSVFEALRFQSPLNLSARVYVCNFVHKIQERWELQDYTIYNNGYLEIFLEDRPREINLRAFDYQRCKLASACINKVREEYQPYRRFPAGHSNASTLLMIPRGNRELSPTIQGGEFNNNIWLYFLVPQDLINFVRFLRKHTLAKRVMFSDEISIEEYCRVIEA